MMSYRRQQQLYQPPQARNNYRAPEELQKHPHWSTKHPQPPINNTIIRNIRSTECIKLDAARGDGRRRHHHPPQRSTHNRPQYDDVEGDDDDDEYEYNTEPGSDHDDSDEEEEAPDPDAPITPAWLVYTPRNVSRPTAYDDITFVPHMTLRTPRAIRWPDYWPGRKPWRSQKYNPTLNPTRMQLEEAHALAGIDQDEVFDGSLHKSIYYQLPSRGFGHNRLDKQHAVLTREINGLYIPKKLVRERLSTPGEGGRQRRLLDLGTSGGNWAIDIAMEFPDVDVLAVDIGGTKPSHVVPPNCNIQYHKFEDSYPHFHEQFDVVHVRSIANGVTDYYKILKELARCLRPGGLLLAADGDFQLLQHDLEPQDICLDDGRKDRPPKYSWLSRVFFETYNFMKERGLEVDAGILLEGRLNKCTVFENIETRTVHTPVGKWARSADPDEQVKLDYCGELMKQNMKMFVRALKPLILACGIPRHQYQQWIDDVDWELDNMNVKCTIRWHYAWATKKEDAKIGDEEISLPEPEPLSDPEPEVDYDEYGNEIPLQRSDYDFDDEEEDEDMEEGVCQCDEEECQCVDRGEDDDWARGRRFEENEYEDSVWSRSPSRSPARKVIELDERYAWAEEEEERKRVRDLEIAMAALELENYEDEEDGEEEGSAYEEDYGEVVEDGPLREAVADVVQQPQPSYAPVSGVGVVPSDYTAPPWPFLPLGGEGSVHPDDFEHNSDNESVDPPSEDENEYVPALKVDKGKGRAVEDLPLEPVAMYPAHLLPSRRVENEEKTDQTPDAVPYTFLDYGQNRHFAVQVPPRMMYQHESPPEYPVREDGGPDEGEPFDVPEVTAEDTALPPRLTTGPAPSPFAPAVPPPNVEVLNAGKLAATLPYPNPLSFPPNPAVGWAPDPEAVANAELRYRLQQQELMEFLPPELFVLPKRKPILPTAPPGGRGLHDGRAGRPRDPTPRDPDDPRSRRHGGYRRWVAGSIH